MFGRPTGSLSLILEILLAASALYLVALLFGYVFGIGGTRRHHVESASYIFAAAAMAAAFARRRETRAAAVEGRRERAPWLVAGFIAAAAILYGNTVMLGLFSDDFGFARDALAGEWFPQPELVRPLPLVLWRVLLSATSGPAALHVLNIGLHGLNAGLVCLLAVRLGLPLAGAVAAGLLFVVFPSSVETVAWPAGVHDLLVTACALAFLLLAGRPATMTRTVAATMVLIVGLLSKESALTIPLLAIVIWLNVGRPRRTPGWPVLVAGLTVCLLYAVVRMALVPVSDAYALGPTRYLVKEVIARPVATFTLPWASAILTSWPILPFLCATACVAVVAAYARSRSKAVAPMTIVRCLVAVFVAVGPAYWLLFVTPDLENTRYLYLSTAFWAIAVAGMASAPGGLTRVPLVMLAGVLIAGVFGVQMHLTSWKEAARLRERVLAAAEDVLESAPCPTVSFVGAPDSVRGAYVFRNGLSAAIALRTGASPAHGTGDCEFVWDGSGFQRTATPSAAPQASFLR